MNTTPNRITGLITTLFLLALLIPLLLLNRTTEASDASVASLPPPMEPNSILDLKNGARWKTRPEAPGQVQDIPFVMLPKMAEIFPGLVAPEDNAPPRATF